MENLSETELKKLFMDNTISIGEDIVEEEVRYITFDTFKKLIESARKEGHYYGKLSAVGMLEELMIS